MTFEFQVDNVQREQNILAHTCNPFVVKLYYSFQSAKDLFLVGGWVGGWDPKLPWYGQDRMHCSLA